MRTLFGEFILDDSTRQLTGSRGEVHLSPKAFQLLSMLIEARPKAIAKRDLHERLWPSTFVSEGGLASVIGELRSALGDDAREPRFIRTVFAFGYSFCAEVRTERNRETATAAVMPVSVARRWTGRIVVVLAALGSAALSRSYVKPSESVAPRIRSIAILPFNTIGSEQGNEHLGLGLADVLITRMSTLRQVMIRPTSAVAKYAPEGRDSVRVGRELGVDAILEGNVRRSGDRIRVTVQLVNVASRQPIWGGKFDDKVAEMFSLEDSISEKVSESLTVQLNHLEKEGLSKRYTESATAYELYVKGRYFLYKVAPDPWRRKDARKKGLDYLRQAVAEDPTFALAFASLAHAYGAQAIYQDAPAVDLWVRSSAAARRSVQLDGNLSEAHCAVGMVEHCLNRNWAQSEKELRRALELNPNNILAHRHYAWLLQNLGRFDEAIPLRERAIELDPSDLTSWREAGWTYYLARRYDEAIQRYETTLQMDPTFIAGHRGLSDVYDQKGMYDKAIASGTKALELQERGATVAWLGYHYARAGNIAKAEELLKRLNELRKHEYVSPYHVAVLYTGLGRTDEALSYLGRAYSEKWAANALVEPAFDPLRNDPRFVDLMRRAGFNKL